MFTLLLYCNQAFLNWYFFFRPMKMLLALVQLVVSPYAGHVVNKSFPNKPLQGGKLTIILVHSRSVLNKCHWTLFIDIFLIFIRRCNRIIRLMSGASIRKWCLLAVYSSGDAGHSFGFCQHFRHGNDCWEISRWDCKRCCHQQGKKITKQSEKSLMLVNPACIDTKKKKNIISLTHRSLLQTSI